MSVLAWGDPESEQNITRYVEGTYQGGVSKTGDKLSPILTLESSEMVRSFQH